MKTLFFLILTAAALVSCTQETVTPEPVSYAIEQGSIEDQVYLQGTKDRCTLGYLQIFAVNAKFIRTADIDTIWFSVRNHIDGSNNTGRWIDGSIDWNCIGFNRICEDYTLTIWSGSIVCKLTIPGGVNCENQ